MKRRGFAATMARRIASVFSTNALGLVFGLINTILATRLLGPAGRGQVVLAINVASVVQTLSTLGLPWAVNYYIARDRDNPASRSHTAWLVLRFAPLLMACWAIASIVVFILRGTAALRGLSPGLVVLSALFSALLLVKQMQTSCFAGLHDFRNRNVVWATSPGVVAALLVANLAMRLTLSPVLVLWMNVLGTCIATAFGFAVLLRRHGVVPANWPEGPRAGEFLRYGLKFYVGLIAQTLNYRVDAFLVNAFLDVRRVGLYATAVSITELLLLVPGAVNVVMYPTIAALKGEERDRVTILSTGATLWAVVVLGSLWVAAARFVVPIVFGARFAEAVAPVYWLAPGMAGIAVERVLCHAAAGAGHPEILTYATVAGLVFTVPLDLLLIPRMGINGAALASSIAYGASAGMAVYLYSRMTGVSSMRVWARLLVDPPRRVLVWAAARKAAAV